MHTVTNVSLFMFCLFSPPLDSSGLGLHSPELLQRIEVSVEFVAIAPSNSGNLMRLQSKATVGVLPHRPDRPICGNNRRRPVLRQPKPALRQNWVIVGTQQFLYVMSGIKSRPHICALVYM